MNKVKKVATGIGLFIVSKVYTIICSAPTYCVALYAVDPGVMTRKPRTKVHTILNNISKIGKIAIPVVLFTIGLFVVLSKKITKRVKVILISVLAVLGILGYALMNYIEINF